MCIIGHSPGNCFFFQQVFHLLQPSPCVFQELTARTPILTSLSQTLPALVAQLVFLVATVYTPPCFLFQLLARRKQDGSSYPFLFSDSDVWWNLLTVVSTSPRVQVDLMGPLVLVFILFFLCQLSQVAGATSCISELPNMNTIPVVLLPCPLSRDPPNLAQQGFFSSPLRALCPSCCVWSCKVMIDATLCIFLERSHSHHAMPCPTKGREAYRIHLASGYEKRCSVSAIAEPHV